MARTEIRQSLASAFGTRKSLRDGQPIHQPNSTLFVTLSTPDARRHQLEAQFGLSGANRILQMEKNNELRQAQRALDTARSLTPVTLTELKDRGDIFARFALAEIIDTTVSLPKPEGTVYTSASYAEKQAEKNAANAQEVELWREVKNLLDLGFPFSTVNKHIQESRSNGHGVTHLSAHLLRARR